MQMNESFRTNRVSDVIRKEVSEILLREVKDPRLTFVTITHVSVSKDLKNAKIFFTTMKEGEDLDAMLQGLKRAAGYVQRKLGSRIHLRYTPHISFLYDSSLEKSSRIDNILKDIEEKLPLTED